jgi:hypothetical protein
VARGGSAGTVELAREGTRYEVDPATGEFALAAERDSSVTEDTSVSPAITSVAGR